MAAKEKVKWHICTGVQKMVLNGRNLIIFFYIEKQKNRCLEKMITKNFFLKYYQNTFRIAQKKCIISNKYSIEKNSI